MIEQIYLSLILVGITIGVVLLYLWRQTREVNRITLALIRLNEKHDFDTLAFLPAAWSLLEQAGLGGLDWQLDWFGIPVVGQSGKPDGPFVFREITLSEIRLEVRVFMASSRGERRFFNESLIETFLLLLRTDMSIKAGASDATFTQMAKQNMFLQHDVKNIAQFIQLMSDQLATVPPGKELQILTHLRKAAPLVRQRADRIVQTLTLGQLGNDPASTIHLAEQIAKLCALHELDNEIVGLASVQIPAILFDGALDNILKNYTDLRLRNPGLRPMVHVAISKHEQDVQIMIEAVNTPPVLQMERLFEPFWSSDPAGLGIGLYQAKHMLEACGATLAANTSASGRLQFELRLPHKSS